MDSSDSIAVYDGASQDEEVLFNGTGDASKFNSSRFSFVALL